VARFFVDDFCLKNIQKLLDSEVFLGYHRDKLKEARCSASRGSRHEENLGGESDGLVQLMEHDNMDKMIASR